MTDEVLVEATDHVLIITMNRPRVLNAVNVAMAEQIASALDRLDSSDNLRVGILAGAGGNFCVGMDLVGFAEGQIPTVEGRGFAGIVGRPPDKPLIAAVDGYALGGGCEIMLACDVIVASTTSRIGLPEVARGQVADGGGVIRLVSRIPFHAANEILLSGNHITGARAYELGLACQVAAPEATRRTAEELAQRISQNAPLALVATKRLVAETERQALAPAFELQDQIAVEVNASADAAEGAQAFIEKRSPTWQGR